jgi:hypothetical protein
MYRSLLLPLILLLASCDSETETKPRDLNDAISFSELVDKRMQIDSTVDGQVILITSEVNSYFIDDCYLVNPSAPRECTEELYLTEVSEPSYSSKSVGVCNIGIALTDNDFSEELIIDFDEYNEFLSLGNEYNVPVNFYAKVEFVERSVYCSDQINYGIKITLQDGEEAHLLEQLK